MTAPHHVLTVALATPAERADYVRALTGDGENDPITIIDDSGTGPVVALFPDADTSELSQWLISVVDGFDFTEFTLTRRHESAPDA